MSNKLPRIIAFVGLPFTGKSTARELTQEILDEKGIANDYVYFGVPPEVERRNAAGEWTEDEAKLTFQQKERLIREAWRAEHGMGVMAMKALPEIEQHITEGKVVLIDNLYSEEEREILVEKYGENELLLVAMATDWDVRVARAAHREYRPLSEDELAHRDDTEIRNLHKAPPIARAHVTIVNNNDDPKKFEQAKQELKNEIEVRVLGMSGKSA